MDTMLPVAEHAPRLRVAMLAPPWMPVPAPGYGGIEEVIRLLSGELVSRGHDVTLFAPPGSTSTAEVVELLDCTHPEEIEVSIVEAAHVGMAFDLIDHAGRCGRPFDILHDHCPGVTLAMADRVDVPVVHTLHGQFDAGRAELYRRHGNKATLVAISADQRAQAPEGAVIESVIPNPLDLDEWPFCADKEDSLLFIGRMDPDKGPDRAIQAAALAGRRLILAGPVQPDHGDFFESQVAPHLDDGKVSYLGAVEGEQRVQLFARSRALLMPIEWAEPFGLVMVEALACGTPVIAFNRGSAPEIVDDGETGFLVQDVAGMALAIGQLDQIDPAACRASVSERFGLDRVVDAYEAAYMSARQADATQTPFGVPSTISTSITSFAPAR